MAEQGCKLFIYGVDQNFENSGLQAEFEKFGTVTDVYNTGKGFAFVTFERKEDAEAVSWGPVKYFYKLSLPSYSSL